MNEELEVKEVEKPVKRTTTPKKPTTRKKATSKPKASKTTKSSTGTKRVTKPKVINKSVEDNPIALEVNTIVDNTFKYDTGNNNVQSEANKPYAKMGRPRKFISAMDMYIEGMAYFEERERNKKPITITGLCLALETTRETLCDYENGKYNDNQNDYSYTIKRLKMMVEDGYEQKLHGTTAAGAIFALKNFGWKDVVDVNTNKQPEELTTQDIQDLASRRVKALKKAM
jgi:hypothetical protein